ncbi:MAG: class I SAM-dependent methyltransferase [Candidatus Omnitrophica bacterium]|nr:class I SAM-dependent methyltransferase [Candidatus Omnitrophota bacterium]MCM8788187.1 class I SAM-dependent methyltransferase [Candidatus Omnitrophota bacterium]
MKIGKCRICGSALFEKPSLVLKNVPSRAQFLPSKRQLRYDKGINLEIFQCRFCGVVQLSNDPVNYYKKVIRATGISKEMTDFRRKQFSKFVESFSLAGKKIVEIGCGAGEFLAIMNQTGAIAYGIEYDKGLVNLCRDRGLKVVRDFVGISTHVLKGGPFDAFIMFSYLEHLPYPCETLKGVFNNLKDDAVGIVEVPNFDMILRKNLFSEFMLDHLFYFTKESLKITLNLSGFEIVKCNEIWHQYIISAIVKKRKIFDFSGFLDAQKKICEKIDQYLLKFEDKKVAIWGAGHQALAVLCFLKQLRKIKYVIDSAPFKQGRYTPVTHIPIVSPGMLGSDPVDTIIVMAGSYSEEIIKTIRYKYKGTKLIKLQDF